MTLKEIETGGVDDGTGTFEELPEEVLNGALGADIVEEITTTKAAMAAAEPVIRHLAIGTSLTTLCGVAKAGASFAHPSKAKRSDCQACKDVFRLNKAPAPAADGFKAGDRIEVVNGDGSAWLVKSVRPGGADVLCVLDGATYKKGHTLTISTGSPVRVFTAEEWATASAPPAKPAPATATTTAAKPGAPAEAKPKGVGKWAPTKADVDQVREFRRLGHNYRQIEADMGWPAGNGNRPFRIMKNAWNYDLLKEK